MHVFPRRKIPISIRFQLDQIPPKFWPGVLRRAIALE